MEDIVLKSKGLHCTTAAAILHLNWALTMTPALCANGVLSKQDKRRVWGRRPLDETCFRVRRVLGKHCIVRHLLHLRY